MKKKLLVTLLAFALTASMVCGCGNRSNQNMAVDSTELSEEDAAPTAEPETAAGTEEDSKESEEEAEATPTPEPTQTPEPTADGQKEVEGTETTKESEEETTAATPAPAETTAPVAENPDTVTPTEQSAAYMVTELSATMYAQNAVNLRQGPGTGYAKVGALTKGQQVTVTGLADNGWYQLDNGAFVSNKYLDITVPAATAVATTPVDQTGEVIPLVIPSTVEPYVANASEFFDYLNQQRSAAGLCTLNWDSDMAAVAQRRAKELVSDFSHNGNVERYNENIHTTNNLMSTYIDWYNSFYNSQAHRDTMMNPNIGRGSAALYFDGYNYYIICNFAGIPLTPEQQLEQLKPENLVPAGGNESGTTTSYSTTGETVTPSQIADELGISEQEVQDRLDALGWN